MSNQTRSKFSLATPTTEFNSQTLRKLLYSAKSFQELAPAKKYLVSYFARSDVGVYRWIPDTQVFKHYPRKIAEDSFIQNDGIEFKNNKGEVLGRFNLQAWFFRDTPFFTPQVNPFQPKVYREANGGYRINEFAGFLYPNPPPFHEFSQEVRNQVKLILNHMEEVLCSSDKKQTYYMKNLVMRIAIGQKLQKTMFLYSGPGTGKTMLTWFLRERVLGPKITVKKASEKIITGQFNKELEGKCLLVLEEMSNSKSTDWITFANRLKDFIDSDTLTIEEKHRTPYPVANITNLIISSNNSKTIRLDRNDRRYFIPDISEKYVENGIGMDHYYAPLDSAIKNPEVGKAFYSYALEYVKLNPDFNERKIPMTATKLMMINRDNNKVHEFIKEKYVIQHKELSESSSGLYHDFKGWFETIDAKKRPPTVQEFTRALGELGLKAIRKRVGDRKHDKKMQWYSATYTELYTVFMKKNMIDETENIEEPEDYQQSETLTTIPPEVLPFEENASPNPAPIKSAIPSESKPIKQKKSPPPLPPKPDHIKERVKSLKSVSVKKVSEPEVDPISIPLPESPKIEPVSVPEPVLEPVKESIPEPCGIPGPSKPAELPKSACAVKKADPDPMPKMGTTKYWEWMDRHRPDYIKPWYKNSRADMIDELYNTAKECWSKYIDEDDPYDWDMLLTELEEYEKITCRDTLYLVQFGEAIDRLKEWIKYNNDLDRSITCRELANYLKSYNENRQAEFVPPPSGYKTVKRLQPQKVKCHSTIDEREHMQAMGEEESDYDEDGLLDEVDQL
jgi:Family of unknown function (DUF5906)